MVSISQIAKISKVFTAPALTEEAVARACNSTAKQVKMPSLMNDILEIQKNTQTKTLFDTFCETMQKEQNAEHIKNQIYPEIKKQKYKLRCLAKQILRDSQADAKVSSRVKKESSVTQKVQRVFKGMQKNGYEESKGLVHDYLLHDGSKALIGDGFGMRFAIKSEFNKEGKRNADLIYNEIIKTHKSPKRDFNITEFEDYHGTGISTYGNYKIRNKFSLLEYKTPSGYTGHTNVVKQRKATGYTRTNINGYFNGVHGEIQVGGDYTIKWGDIDHLLYDAENKKPLDLSNFKTKKRKVLAASIREAYEDLLKNKRLKNRYKKDYLSKIWKALKTAEEQNKEPVFPQLPAGIPDLLSAETMWKLAHS